jgi:bifunctional isochorismate lyase/aryl carrier protein
MPSGSIAPEKHVADLLDVPADQLGDEANLLDHGLDSIRMISIVDELRAAGVEVNSADLVEQPTLTHWRTVLSGHQP